MELLFRKRGHVTIEDSRRIIKKEIPNVNDSYARTLLQTYFRCTGKKAPETKRCKKWTLKFSPCKKYKNVLDAFVKKGDTNAWISY